VVLKTHQLAFWIVCFHASVGHAALLPEQTLVVHTSEPPEAVGLAQNYAQGRGITRLCELAGEFPSIVSLERYNTEIWPAINRCMQDRPTSTIVTIKGLPIRVANYSLEALLTLGDSMGRNGPLRQQDRSELPLLRNPLAPSPYDGMAWLQANRFPAPFSVNIGSEFNLDLRIVSRIDALTFAAAQGLIERGRQSDQMPPDGRWLCMQGSDPPRAVRDQECAAVLGLLEQAGWIDEPLLMSFDRQLSEQRLTAYFTGSADLRQAIAGNRYPNGAIADNITSLMGVPRNFQTFGPCQEDADCDQGLCVAERCIEEQQTAIGRLIAAGITGTHAATAEPYNNTFPSTLVLALYRAGYSLGESFFYALPFLGWVNTFYGDPLAAPFAQPADLTELPDQLTLNALGYADLELSAPPGWQLTRAAWLRDGSLWHSETFSPEAEQATFDWQPPALGAYKLRVWTRPLPTDGPISLWPRNEAMSQKMILLVAADPIEPAKPPEPAQGCGCSHLPLLSSLLLVSLGLRQRRAPQRGD
jgi:uncharacterized protein (TIGR03790 family)